MINLSCQPSIGRVPSLTGDVIEDARIGPVEVQKARGPPGAEPRAPPLPADPKPAVACGGAYPGRWRREPMMRNRPATKSPSV